MTDVWAKWESQVVNGVFPLRRFLGSSDHSVVFLSEYTALNISDAVIKLMPADPKVADTQLAHWGLVATLAHPHLLRLLDSGRCQLGGHPFLFVVMEYADQTLAQLLPRRALSLEELQEVLRPTLDALAFLHRKDLVHGQLKPQNFLVVNDQLKLATDTIRPVGEPTAGIAKPSSYDAPETRQGVTSAAGDIWGLGMTIVEALTQHPAAWPDDRVQAIGLPAAVAPEFAAAIRRCLRRDPTRRPAIQQLEAAIAPAPQAHPASSAPPLEREAPPTDASAPAHSSPERPRFSVRTLGVGIVAVLAAGIGFHLFHSRPQSRQPLPVSPPPTPQQSIPPAAPVPAPDAPAPPPTSVLHREIPEASRSARDSIRGHLKVTVRVSVDRAGNVVAESLQVAGPSKYFARLATEAARKWKFAPAENAESRAWLLQFEFTRGGTSGHATPKS